MTIDNIINKDLSNTLNENVFRQLNRDTIIFLSDESINGIKKYIENNHLKKTDVKELWKDLLIDSISFLKLNDKREKINTDTKDTIEHSDSDKFNNGFKLIRKLSSYGIDGLADYFDEFIEFESVLYGSDEYYRDHVDHVLNVWAIGLSLLNSQMENFKFSDKALYKDNNFSFEIEETDLFITKGEIWAIWTIVALTHDLGYPIEKASKVNNKLKKILKHFGQINIQEFNYNFELFNSFLVEKFLNIVSSKPVNKNGKKYTIIQSKYKDKISKSLEDNRHGVFSALLIFKTLTYFLETDYSYNQEDLSAEDLRQFYIRKEILRTISSHTSPKLYHLDLNTLSFLLILCDELQEWGRPRFQDLKEGNIQGSEVPKIFIKKFEFNRNSENTEKFEGAISVKLEYKITDFDSKKDDYEKRIKDKFKMFHHLLRSAKDDKLRAFVFEWELEFNKNKVYNFIFDSNQDAYNVLKTPVFLISKTGKKEQENYLEIY